VLYVGHSRGNRRPLCAESVPWHLVREHPSYLWMEVGESIGRRKRTLYVVFVTEQLNLLITGFAQTVLHYSSIEAKTHTRNSEEDAKKYDFNQR